MMTIRQYYLNKLTEECAEISQVVSKQMQFGRDVRWVKSMGEHSEAPSNGEKLRDEVNDLLAVLDVLEDINELPQISGWKLLEAKNMKRRKMAKYLDRSQRLGQVENINRPIGLKIHDTYSIEPEPDATGTNSPSSYGGPNYGPSLT